MNTAESVYNLTISVVEDAAHVAMGMLKTVGRGLSEVLEWLSLIFSWSDIVDTANAIEIKVGDQHYCSVRYRKLHRNA